MCSVEVYYLFCMHCGFSGVFLLLISSLVSLGFESIFYMISILLNLENDKSSLRKMCILLLLNKEFINVNYNQLIDGAIQFNSVLTHFLLVGSVNY